MKDLLYQLAAGPALNIMLEMQYGGPGVEQSIGIGKNYHTVNPQPITWENYEGLEYDINGDPDGKYYANVKVINYPDMSPPTQSFADEATAMAWIRSAYEVLHRNLMAIEDRY